MSDEKYYRLELNADEVMFLSQLVNNVPLSITGKGAKVVAELVEKVDKVNDRVRDDKDDDE